ncbi:MAG TPA: sensor histidine kinase, partial [Ferruginibacter sp.]|nr:sensor histidine kinase [Ferruginibacter sp.]
MKNFISAVVICLLTTGFANAQLLNTDSMLRLLPAAKKDTNKVNLLFALSSQYDHSEPEKSKAFISQAGQLSKELGYDAGILLSYKRMMYVYAFLSANDSAIFFGNKMLDHARQHKDSFSIGVALFNLGERYNYMSDFENGLKYTLQGVNILSGKGYAPRVEAAVLGGLSNTYLMMKNYSKAIEYGKMAEAVERTMDDKGPLTGTLINLGNCYDETGKLAEAEKVYKEAMQLAREYGNLSYESMICQGLVALAQKQNDTEKMKLYAERGLAISTDLKDDFGIMANSQGLSMYYLITKNYGRAKELVMQALKIADENKFVEAKAQVLQSLSNINFAEGDFMNGFKNQREATSLSGNIFTESISQKTADYRVKYETEKKETEIKQLQSEKQIQQLAIRQKNLLNYILIGSAGALLIISLLGYRNYRHKQKLQQQRIAELETQQQLTAAEAVLKGEEQERTRLAKDLHDGLGGMLSGIKFSLNTMKGNLVMTPENANAFERSMDMLDSSIQEMRRVAHNMMPEALVKFGLDTALKDFCNDINQSGALKTNYHSMGLNNSSIDQTMAITIYRIVQELINNSIKHASATSAIVQLTKSGNELSLTVEDDGKGFDTKILTRAKGIGWSNIQSRVDFLKGKLDVNSEP